ncbi:MAG TPA: hypothetical protein VE870_01010 [Bacteroidales bacterium]|nr:hypothetical protein [Bacteroidales bacterium]
MKNRLFMLLAAFAVTACQPETKNLTNTKNTNEPMNVLSLMKKHILLDSSKMLFDEKVTAENFKRDWTVHHSEWKVEDGWLVGRNRGNWPGMAILKQEFPGNVLVEFDASTIAPSTHDINVMWNGEWIEDKDQRGMAYVAGLQGWWTGKVGIEKSPEYKFMTGTPLFDFVPGKLYHIQAGSIDGHCFIFANGQLLLETIDPNPVDNQKYTHVGFEAYSSAIRIKNIRIRQIYWKPDKMSYEPEF